jgi:hypothetical protein
MNSNPRQAKVGYSLPKVKPDVCQFTGKLPFSRKKNRPALRRVAADRFVEQ